MPTKTPPEGVQIDVATLAAALGQQADAVIPDEAVGESPDKKIYVPKGMGYNRARSILQRKQKEEEEVTSFSRRFNYRPWDGAYCTWQVMKRRFGITLGKKTMSFFGENPPEMRDIEIGFGKRTQVPWGQMEIPVLEGAVLALSGAGHSDFGLVFAVVVEAKRKFAAEIEEFLEEIQQELQENSIYRGKAIVGTTEPTFLNLADVDPNKVVYSADVMDQLEATLWGPISHAEAYRRDSIPLRRAICLHGPYGTGKTLAGNLTAQKTTEHEWTFISARVGQDDLADTMRLAKMYQPTVIFFEDVDNATSSGDQEVMSQMLDAFDGITAKGGELIVVLTTNHLERIHKGMLRPGRLDALIEINDLDRAGVEKLVRATVPKGKLDADVEYDLVYEAMEEFLPAFVVESINRASGVALARVEGAEHYTLTTHDLVVAAKSLRPQLDVMNAAQEGVKPPELEAALSGLVSRTLDGTPILDDEDDCVFTLGANGKAA